MATVAAIRCNPVIKTFAQRLEQTGKLPKVIIVARNRPQSSVSLVSFVVESVGAGGDQYVGLDQFGRVVNQN